MRKYEVWQKGDGIVSIFETKEEAKIERKKLQSNGQISVYIKLLKGYRRISDYYQGGY